ncbi:uncharacterized protein LOC144990530 [Oryzias latipes]
MALILDRILCFLEHTLRSPFLKRGTTTTVCQSSGTVPDCHETLQRRVSQDTPTASRDLRYSGRTSSFFWGLATEELVDYLIDFSPGNRQPHLKVLALCSSKEGESVRLRRSSKYSFPSRSQQSPTCTEDNGCGELLSPPEVPDGFPEFLRGQPIVLLHGLTELLPGPSFCLHNSPGGSSLRLLIPVSCFWSPASQPGMVGLFGQLDGIPYFRCPPPGSGVTAATGTRDLATTAPSSSRDNGSGKHGPLGLNVPKLPRYPFEVLPDVGVKDFPNGGLSQTFPEDPHSMFGSSKSFQPPSPPANSTHHHIVIGGQLRPSLHPSVQDTRPKVA